MKTKKKLKPVALIIGMAAALSCVACESIENDTDGQADESSRSVVVSNDLHEPPISTLNIPTTVLGVRWDDVMSDSNTVQTISIELTNKQSATVSVLAELHLTGMMGYEALHRFDEIILDAGETKSIRVAAEELPLRVYRGSGQIHGIFTVGSPDEIAGKKIAQATPTYYFSQTEGGREISLFGQQILLSERGGMLTPSTNSRRGEDIGPLGAVRESDGAFRDIGYEDLRPVEDGSEPVAGYLVGESIEIEEGE